MKRIKIWNEEVSSRQLDDICASLEAGETMVMPTDTLYAIACDALCPKAIEKICRLKGINPEKTNLSIICADISMAAEYPVSTTMRSSFVKNARRARSHSSSNRLRNFRKPLKEETRGGENPGNRLCRDIAERLGHPLLTTSIEYADPDYARDPELIAEAYDGKADFMLLGEEGDTTPSTIVDCTGTSPEIVRQGKGRIND